jgi:hypothetical protein
VGDADRPVEGGPCESICDGRELFRHGPRPTRARDPGSDAVDRFCEAIERGTRLVAHPSTVRQRLLDVSRDERSKAQPIERLDHHGHVIGEFRSVLGAVQTDSVEGFVEGHASMVGSSRWTCRSSSKSLATD